MGQHQCASPFGWTDQPDLPTPAPSEGRFQASPVANLTQPQVEEKDCEARPPHSPILRRKGGAIFSISPGLECSRIRIDCEKITPGRVFLVSRTLFPKLSPVIRRMTRSNKPSLTHHHCLPRVKTWERGRGGTGRGRGGERGRRGVREKRMVKIVVQCRSFSVPSRSSKAEPLGYTQNLTNSLKALMMTGFQWCGGQTMRTLAPS